MNCRRSTRPSAERARARGLSLVEIFAVIGLTGVVLAGVVHFFSQQAHGMRRAGFRIETQQALRGALEAIARDVRLAGACLPTNGHYVGLAGTDDPAGDSITVRTGLVRADLSCVFGTTTADAGAGASIFQVDDASEFVVGKLAYVRDPNGSGELLRVTGAGATSVSVAPGAGQIYPAGSTVYAVDQRTYALDTSTTPPVLFLAVDEDPPLPFAAGIRELQIAYVLDRNCPACDVVDLATPLPTSTWWLVNEVLITMTAETVGGTLPTDQASITEMARAKPRNLLP